MEKRVALALLLSALVLVAWPMVFPPPARPPVAGVAAGSPGSPGSPDSSGAPIAGAPAGEPAGAAPTPAAPARPVEGPLISAPEERSEVIELGQPGQPGHYWMRITNRGARIAELRLGGYQRRVGLDDEERKDPENWAKLLVPVESPAAPAGATGSLALTASVSARDLAPDPLDQALWTTEVLREPDGRARGVSFRYAAGTGAVFEKRIETRPGSWELLVSLAIENLGKHPSGPREFVLTPAACVPAEMDDRFYVEPTAIARGSAGRSRIGEKRRDPKAEELSGELGSGPVLFVGAHNKYFAALLRAADETGANALRGATYRRLRVPGVAGAPLAEYVVPEVHLALALPEPGKSLAWRFSMYVGPKDPAALEAAFAPFVDVVDHDLLQGSCCFVPGIVNDAIVAIGKLLMRVLSILHGAVGNWGAAIILLTLGVRACLFPLNRRSQASMARHGKKMKRVQPKLEEIKQRYADDPQKYREAQAKVMQEEGLFPPLGGCLPMFLQIPVFFGLFAALRTSFDLRQAPFALWIEDLSRPDRMFEIDLAIPLIVTTLNIEYFNLLPILMMALMLAQQLVMPKAADEQQQRMQRMMIFMSLGFGVFLYSYAAGLSLYMITSSSIGLLESTVIKKIWPLDDREPDPKSKKPGIWSKLAERLQAAQREQMRKQQGGQSSRGRKR